MSIFENAKKTPAKKKVSKSAAPEVNVEGIERLAALEALKANLEAQIAIEKNNINEKAMTYFVDTGMATKTRPANFKGLENGSEASLQLKDRSSRSYLNDEMIAVLKDHKIPYDRNVSKEETYYINPEYITDSDMMKMVGENLELLNLPKDFILYQEEEFGNVATKDSVAAVFKLDDEDAVRELLPIVTTQAIKATLSDDVDPFAIVDSIMNEGE